MLYDSRSKLIASWGDGYYMTEDQPSVGILPEPPMIVTFFPCVGKKPSLHSLEQTLRICLNVEALFLLEPYLSKRLSLRL